MARKTQRSKVVHHNAYIDHETHRPVVEAIPGFIRKDRRVQLAREPQQCRFSDGRIIPKVFLIHTPESALDDLCRGVRLKLHDGRARVARFEKQLVHIVDLAQEMAVRGDEEDNA